MSRSSWIRLTGLAVVFVGLTVPAEDASAVSPAFGWVCAEVACGDWQGADAACPSGQYASEMTCSSELCEEGNRIHCVF